MLKKIFSGRVLLWVFIAVLTLSFSIHAMLILSWGGLERIAQYEEQVFEITSKEVEKDGATNRYLVGLKGYEKPLELGSYDYSQLEVGDQLALLINPKNPDDYQHGTLENPYQLTIVNGEKQQESAETEQDAELKEN